MTQKNDPNDGSTEGLLGEMVLGTDPSKKQGKAGLLADPPDDGDGTNFPQQISSTLSETEERVLGFARVNQESEEGRSWRAARAVVEKFQPVPWFIWRLSNFVFGSKEPMTKVPEGLTLGLRRLLFAAASDSVLGKGEKVNNVRTALEILSPDVVAAVSVIHAICRRLTAGQNERIWKPILDDALLRAQIGHAIGSGDPKFGHGRGMLAGFAGRSGLAILISLGDIDQARRALELLAGGAEISNVGYTVYDCEPLQVSAMTLSASGCGRSAAFGTVSFASKTPEKIDSGDEHLKWLAAFTITEHLRSGSYEKIQESHYRLLNINSDRDRNDIKEYSKTLTRLGHAWQWLA